MLNERYDEDLLRRALEADDSLRGRDPLPFTLTPAEMRAEVERALSEPGETTRQLWERSA